MTTFARRIKNFLKSEDGPTAVEYAVMLALIVVACIGVINALSGSVQNTFENVTDELGGGTP